MKAYISGISNYFNFRGRASRAQFWLFFLFVIIINVVMAIADTVIATDDPETGFGLLLGQSQLFHFIPALAVSARRLHDSDRTAWWLLAFLIPVVGWILLIVFFCMGSTPGANRWGILQSSDRAAKGDIAVGKPNGSETVVERLEKIAALHASGVLSDDEYRSMKQKII